MLKKIKILFLIIPIISSVFLPVNHINAIIPSEDTYPQDQYAGRYHRNVETKEITHTTINYAELAKKVEAMEYIHVQN